MAARKMTTTAVVAIALAGMTTIAAAGEKFVPKGHSYRPGNDRLPGLNTRQDRISNRADIYETEIYRIQRERAIQDAELRRLIEHDLTGGTNFQPRF